jgi:hypothetical protein
MRQQQKFMTTLSLIVALSGLSPVVAADAGGTSGGERVQPDQRQFERPMMYKLTPEQMDNLHAGVQFIPFIDPWRLWSIQVYCIVVGTCGNGRYAN